MATRRSSLLPSHTTAIPPLNEQAKHSFDTLTSLESLIFSSLMGICFRIVSAPLLLGVPIFLAVISVVLIAPLYSLFPLIEASMLITALVSVKFEQLFGQPILSTRWCCTAV